MKTLFLDVALVFLLALFLNAARGVWDFLTADPFQWGKPDLRFMRWHRRLAVVTALLIACAMASACFDRTVISPSQVQDVNQVQAPPPSPAPSPSASPTASSCDPTAIDKVNVTIVPSAGKLSATDVALGSTVFITATPKDSSGQDVDPKKHGPSADWTVFSGGVALGPHDENVFNRDMRALTKGAYEVRVIVCGHTGTLAGSVK